jgi:DNA repair exonuclease SbcCD nuclease subunit
MCDKIGIVGDIHIGARSGSKVFRQLFREYFRDVFFPLIKTRGIKKIIQLGDFFDNRNSVTLHDIDYVINEFIPQLEDTGAIMYVLAGNHDVAHKNTNAVNSLSMLRTSNNIVVVDNEIETVETESKTFVLCPWINDENQNDLLSEVASFANKNHILCGHFEFAGMKMYKNSKLSDHGLDPIKFKKFYMVISGHFHHPSTYGNVSYMGSVFHLNWMDANDSKYVYIFDTNTNEFEQIENIYNPFTEFEYHEDDLFNMSDTDLKDFCHEQFIRIHINKEYKRVDLKEVISRIEKLNPLTLDVIDNTIIDVDASIEEQEKEDSKTKEFEDYAEDYIKGDKNLYAMFKDIEQEARDKMKEIE